jgi:hypothetical protein
MLVMKRHYQYIWDLCFTAALAKSHVDKMSQLGLCISSDRVQHIESTMTIALCDAYMSLGNVVPSNLTKDIFTTASIDNIDQNHNPSSVTATTSFTASSATVIQHLDRPDVRGRVPPSLQLADVSWTRKISCTLPGSYTAVPAIADVTSEIPMSSVNASLVATDINQFQLLGHWLSNVKSIVCGNTEDNGISFAAYHSRVNVQAPILLSVAVLCCHCCQIAFNRLLLFVT